MSWREDYGWMVRFNPLNAGLNPICQLLALVGAHHILHVSRVRVNVQRTHFEGHRLHIR